MIIPTYGEIAKQAGKQLVKKILPYATVGYAGYETAGIFDEPVNNQPIAITINQTKPDTDDSTDTWKIVVGIVIIILVTVTIGTIVHYKLPIKRTNTVKKTDADEESEQQLLQQHSNQQASTY